MKNKTLKRLSIFTSAMLATLLIAPGVSTIVNDIRGNIVYALDGNQVFFKETEYEVGDSNIVYATLRLEGEIGDTIAVSYATRSGTAIEGIDYQGVTNSISIKIPASHYYEYKIAVKCLDDNDTSEYSLTVVFNDTYPLFDLKKNFILHLVAIYDNRQIDDDNLVNIIDIMDKQFKLYDKSN